MWRTIGVIVLLVAVVLVAAVAYNALNAGFRPGDDVNLEKYPVLPSKQPMDVAEISRLGLKKVKLHAPIIAFVYDRYGIDQWSDRQSHWHWRWVRHGTLVAVDPSGRPWYVVGTSIRLYVPSADGDGFWFFWPSWLNPANWSLPWWWPLLVPPGLLLLGYGLYRWLKRPLQRSSAAKEKDHREPIRPPEPETERNRWLREIDEMRDRIQERREEQSIGPTYPSCERAAEKTEAMLREKETSAAVPVDEPKAVETQPQSVPITREEFDGVVGRVDDLEGRVDSAEGEIATIKDLFTAALQRAEQDQPAPLRKTTKSGLKAKLAAKAGKAKKAGELTDAEIGAKIASGEMTFDQVAKLRRNT